MCNANFDENVINSKLCNFLNCPTLPKHISTMIYIRPTLANDKNENKTENCFLFLFKRHKTALAVSTEQKVDNNIEQS